MIKSWDNAYKVGQRIVVSQENIDVFVSLLEKMKFGIESAINEDSNGELIRFNVLILNCFLVGVRTWFVCAHMNGRIYDQRWGDPFRLIRLFRHLSKVNVITAICMF